jgi:hypothetical protein
LKNEAALLKNVQRTQAQVMRSKKHEWEIERKTLMIEKRKLEYDMYDLVQVSFANNENLKKVWAIYDD